MNDLNQQFNNNDEILVLDESGNFKILAGGQLKSYQMPEMTQAGNLPLKSIPPRSTMQIIDTGMEEKMLQPPPPAIIKNTASFYFHPEDEEEAAKYQMDKFILPIQKKYSLDKIVFKIIENYKLVLSDQLKSRLRLIVFNYLRDRRSDVDTQSLFFKKADIGGLDLPKEIADNLFEFLKEIKEKIKVNTGIVVNEKDEAVQFQAVYKKPEFGPQEKIKPIVLNKIPLADQLIGPDQPASDGVSDLPPRPGLTPKVNGPLPRFQRPVKTSAKQVDDVKKDYKLSGPVEELSSLSLEIFHRLGEITSQRTAKIISKIDFLSQKSIAKRSAGIRAWRQSPLYRMYVALGQASMEHNLPVEQIIEEYAKKGHQIISLEEFEAISDLNRQLRF